MKRSSLVVAACSLLGIAWLAACRPVSTVDRQEQHWRSRGIADYRLRALDVRSIWHAETLTITVRAGALADHSAACIPAPIESGKCAVRAYDPLDYTIEGLFARARAELRIDGGRYTQVAYDPACGFPIRIAYDHPDIVDEDRVLRVTAFEAPGAPGCLERRD